MSGGDERLERLESRLMLAEDQIDALNRAIYHQQGQIDQLRARLLQLAQQFQSTQAAGSSRPEDEIPPHW
ncbi:MAG: SlyX family protein [Azoarcus sp.]|jgi:SlyX protein|nr:SlyX family protein [Azoarcus sp.]